MTDFDSRSFISTESVENLETQEVSTTPTVKNAKRVLQVDASGNVLSGMSIPTFDYVARVLTNSTTETYTFRTGGSGGTVVATLVVVYTDSNLTTISSITKT